ncbi:hypothetical protein B879_02472 [Cecembia lonarensis LW9]|uniref:Tryptophan-rich sensory protein n=1 Tax=Cecembia lonarensis (strain CCUG 58316 / KCTC 22772 / LW9) TaxID=1225176 RepID=K1LXH8_CECL9|nr:hypothetical protein B879_02472 [Cecembia lonarensis LW9]
MLLLIFNTITFFASIYLNYLFGSGAGGRKSVGEVSRKFETLITPAGYAFSIWGLIYLLLLGFLSYQWVSYFKGNPQKSLTPTFIWFSLSNVLNGLWIIVWTQEMIGVSVLVIFGLLGALIFWAKSLQVGSKNRQFYVFIGLPICVYMGWIIVASVVNASVWFYQNDWFIQQELIMTTLTLTIATFIFLWLSVKRNLLVPTWVGIWALVAILVKLKNPESLVFQSITVLVFMLLISNLIVLKNKKYHSKYFN